MSSCTYSVKESNRQSNHLDEIYWQTWFSRFTVNFLANSSKNFINVLRNPWKCKRNGEGVDFEMRKSSNFPCDATLYLQKRFSWAFALRFHNNQLSMCLLGPRALKSGYITAPLKGNNLFNVKINLQVFYNFTNKFLWTLVGSRLQIFICFVFVKKNPMNFWKNLYEPHMNSSKKLYESFKETYGYLIVMVCYVVFLVMVFFNVILRVFTLQMKKIR